MRNKKLDQIVDQMESYVECWKQFNHYIGLARSRKFTPEDEEQFLEVKSLLTQQLEAILASVETTNPTRDEILALVGNAPSIRYLSELGEGPLRGVENQWHRIYIGCQSMLGQLKVKQRELESRSVWDSWFGGSGSSNKQQPAR